MMLLASDFGGILLAGIALLLGLLSATLSVVAIGLLGLAAYRLRETTCVAPILWTIFSLALWVCLLVGQLQSTQGTYRSGDWQPLLAGALLSMACPMVAVLGARRPQNKIWPLVVASLFAIFIIPVLPNLLGQGDRDLAQSVWKWFYAGLLLVGWLNYLPTRLMPAATLWCLPGWWWTWSNDFPWGLTVLPGLACIIGVLSARRSKVAATPGDWNRVWRDFRNLYGVVWSLRVMERANALADSVGAQVRLDWWGLHPVATTNEAPADAVLPPRPEQMALLEPGLRNLLRRFVSDRWIDVRLPPAPNAAVR